MRGRLSRCAAAAAAAAACLAGVVAPTASAAVAEAAPDRQAAPAPASVQPDLVGGAPADRTYPFMASLQEQGEHGCGAALVRPTWLVTAAHCVQGPTGQGGADQDSGPLTARIGSNDRTAGGELAEAAEVVVHPSFEYPGSTGDIALIRLSEPVSAQPIDIATPDGDTPPGEATSTDPGTPTRLLGWGQTCPENGCGDAPVKLQQVDTQIVDGERCAAGFDPASEVCTGNPDGAGACYGDSGGPQVVRSGERWRLVGVSSRAGNNDPVCGSGPSIYTSAPAYTGWIEETTAG
ncbi:secreted trypsin-like serine protease [Prauserella sediminis]|uniref:Secreted trypsin-like serine protease n=1 Tax=Prauserella sediminis TaxID=577680 RepID=A0A839XQP2_9PSEU|nr:serine protease [Prauserella sediminis]MBB3663794.1 secreted trypsin-like serine protease [Prauserella sediminis]